MKGEVEMNQGTGQMDGLETFCGRKEKAVQGFLAFKQFGTDGLVAKYQG